MRQQQTQLIISDVDYKRLSELTLSQENEIMEQLAEELARASIVPREKLPEDVVTMNSAIEYQDEETGETRQIQLVYPNQANSEQSQISVLAPIGLALLGLREGQSIEWPMPSGKKRRLRVLKVLSSSELPPSY